MAKKSSIAPALKKARGLLAKDERLSKVLRQISEATKEPKQRKAASRRLLLPYVDAKPLNVGTWK